MQAKINHLVKSSIAKLDVIRTIIYRFFSRCLLSVRRREEEEEEEKKKFEIDVGEA